MPAVRDAVDTDAAAIALVHVESWQAAYRGMFPDTYLDSLRVEDRLDFWESSLATRREARRTVLVAVDDTGQVVGFSASRPTQDDEATVELGGLYLRPSAWGHGIGRLLLARTVERFRRDGYKRAILWVHPDNTRARHVYEVAGWAFDHVERSEVVWGVEAAELRYSLDLKPAAPMPLYYADYLRLDRLLSAQAPRSRPVAHDELLFIIVHQTFELWFKQILFELDAVLSTMGQPVVAEKQLGNVVDRLHRIGVIERLLIHEIDVLETMTPLDFLEFRDELIPASGFQSAQFRLIENKLGLDPTHRLRIKGTAYTSVLQEKDAAAVQQSERQPSLHDHVERWLERTPFLSFGTFDFWSAYQDAVNTMLESDRERAASNDQLAAFDQTVEAFRAMFDAGRWNELRAAGKRRLSHRAFLAALLINLYRDEPIFQLPFRLLTGLIDVDEGFTTWRQRHALLAHRMIGSRIGTGGTSGHAYLEAAANRHRVFTDLFDLPSYFIPRSSLPALPDDVQEQMGFRYR